MYGTIFIVVFIFAALYFLIRCISKLVQRKNVTPFKQIVDSIKDEIKGIEKLKPKIPERIFANSAKRKRIINQKQKRKYIRQNPNQTRFK